MTRPGPERAGHPSALPAERDAEAGVILVNVLVILAIAAAMVMLMLTSQEATLERSRIASAGAQAEALALAGEVSVAVALRRDMAEAPEADHLAEGWASVLQEPVTLPAGRFAVEVRDLQSGFDLNRLAPQRLGEMRTFARLLSALELPGAIGPRIAARIGDRGPLGDLDDLRAIGLSAEEIESLRPHVSVLPPDPAAVPDALGLGPAPAPINLNTASPLLLGVLLGNPGAAQRLAALRERKGFVDAGDLGRVGALLPQGAGFASDSWEARVLAEVDGVVVELTSGLLRRPREGDVIVTGRRFGSRATPPPDAVP